MKVNINEHNINTFSIFKKYYELCETIFREIDKIKIEQDIKTLNETLNEIHQKLEKFLDKQFHIVNMHRLILDNHKNN